MALITGASAGLGLEFAWQLAAAKHDLVLVARNAERLEKVAAQINGVCGVKVEVLPADLSVADDVNRVAERLRADHADGLRPVGLLINNAGFATAGTFLSNDLALEENALDVMVGAVMVLSHAAANAMVARGRGAILNVSSIGANMATTSYSPAKSWVRSFTEGLAVDLRGTGVTATVVLPGFVHTEFHERANLDKSAIPEFAWLRASDVVSEALAAVRRGSVIVTPSLRYKIAGFASRHAPRALIRRMQG